MFSWFWFLYHCRVNLQRSRLCLIFFVHRFRTAFLQQNRWIDTICYLGKIVARLKWNWSSFLAKWNPIILLFVLVIIFDILIVVIWTVITVYVEITCVWWISMIIKISLPSTINGIKFSHKRSTIPFIYLFSSFLASIRRTWCGYQFGMLFLNALFCSNIGGVETYFAMFSCRDIIVWAVPYTFCLNRLIIFETSNFVAFVANTLIWLIIITLRRVGILTFIFTAEVMQLNSVCLISLADHNENI